MIAMNILSNLKVFNGATNGSVSAKYPTLFTPAGYAFSIWSVIFIWLGLFVIYQAFPRHIKEDGMVARISVLFIINMISNGVWSIAFNFEVIWLTEVIMLVTLATLIAIYVRLGIGKELSLLPARCQIGDRSSEETPLLTFWLIHSPFSIYLGWISVATIANTSILLWNSGVQSNQETASVIMMVVATALAVLMLVDRQDVIFASVVVWALIAIGFKQADFAVVKNSAFALAGILAAVTVGFFAYRIRNYLQSRKTIQRL